MAKLGNESNKAHGSAGSAEPTLSLRIEYVGVIAVVCLVLGAIIGSVYLGGNTAVSSEQGHQHAMVDENALMEKANATTNPEELVHIGNEAYDAGAPKAAIVAYEKALKVEPHNADVLTDTGAMYLQLKEYDVAIDRFKQAMDVDPKHANSRFNLGIALMSGKRDYKAAAKAFRECMRIAPDGEIAKAAKAHLDSIEKNQE